LLALAALEPAERRPALVLIGGLPGVGKSTLARALAAACGFEIVQSDRVRKQLAGLPDEAAAPAPFGGGIYTPEHSARTYAECWRRAEAQLLAGRRAIVDANFALEAQRRPFMELAKALALPLIFVQVVLDPALVERRLAERRFDASDADFAIHRQMAARWQDGSDQWRSCRIVVDAADSASALERARQHLVEQGLMG
jgi:hypothetical protein